MNSKLALVIALTLAGPGTALSDKGPPPTAPAVTASSNGADLLKQVDAALNPPQSAPPSQIDDMVAHLPGNVRGRDQIIARMRAGVQPLSGQQSGVGSPRIGMQPLGMGV